MALGIPEALAILGTLGVQVAMAAVAAVGQVAARRHAVRPTSRMAAILKVVLVAAGLLAAWWPQMLHRLQLGFIVVALIKFLFLA